MKIDGRQIAQDILDGLKEQVEELKKKDIVPHLAIILVGDNPASVAYVRQKELKAKSIGIQTTILHLSNKTSQSDLIETIQQFNNDNNIHGIIVQQPLPQQMDTKKITQTVDPKKDVDGFHSDTQFQMPIAMAVLEILEEVFKTKSEARSTKSEINPKSQTTKPVSSFDIQYSNFTSWLKTNNITVIGKGETGGKPIINALQKLGVEPEIIDSKTENPQNLTKKADIIICAVGKPNVLRPEMIKKGVILISIGISRGESAKLTGDYDQNEVKKIASFYTPTPGGVGPVNVAMLLKNLIIASENFSR